MSCHIKADHAPKNLGEVLSGLPRAERVPVPDQEAFFTAARKGDLTGVKAYVEAGGDIEARNDCGDTALRLLTLYRGEDHSRIFKYLIENGADVHAVAVYKPVDGEKFTSISPPMNDVAWVGNADYIPLLAKAGASLNARGARGNGETPLSLAFRLERFDCAEALLRSRADPNIYNIYSEGNRFCALPKLPLQAALRTQNLKLAQSLIAAKADVNLKEVAFRDNAEHLYSPIRWAKHICPKAISCLVAAGANVKKEEVAMYLGKIGPFIRKGLILQVIRIEEIAQIISEYSKEDHEILNASIIQDASVQPYIDPRKFLSSKSTSGIFKIQEGEIISQFVPVKDLANIIAEYADLSKEESDAVCQAAPLLLNRLSWECEGERDAQARSAKINKGIGQLPKDLQERIYTEVFLRSKNPAKPELATFLEEQLNWAKKHIGDDMRVLGEVIQLFFGPRFWQKYNGPY